MRLFLYKLALFFLPFLLLSYPLDLVLSNYLSHSNGSAGEIEVMKQIYNGTIDSDIAIYGSSRAWVHVNPKILQDSLHQTAYNFGVDAHNFWLQYLRHLEYLKHNRKPSSIIVSLDIFSLEIRNDLYGLEQFLPHMLWNENIEKYTSRYTGFTKLDYYLPLVRYIGKRKALKMAFSSMKTGEERIPYRNRGFRGIDKTWNSDLKDAKAVMKEYNIKLHEQSVQLFKQFIQECKEMDISLILVCSPEYIEGQKFVVNREDIISLYNNIAKENGLLFLDFSDNEICLNRDLFYNSLHLNKTGADLFTKELVSHLRQLN